jgi:hypothetical protein
MKNYFIKIGNYVYEPLGWAKSFGFIECVLRLNKFYFLKCNLHFENVKKEKEK